MRPVGKYKSTADERSRGHDFKAVVTLCLFIGLSLSPWTIGAQDSKVQELSLIHI